MKFLIQKVSQASVYIHETQEKRSIGAGFVVYVGISTHDLEEDRQEKVDKFVRRVGKFDLFSTPENKKFLNLQDISGELLIISNFTLYGRNKKGRSIDFCHAAGFAEAKVVYEYLLKQLKLSALPFQTGHFGAQMDITSICDGPVNVVLEW